jgi:hypothetical protein
MSAAVVAVAVLGVGGCSGGDDGAPAGQAVGPASATAGPGTVEGLDDCVSDGVEFRVEVPEPPHGDKAGFRVAKVVVTGTGTRPCLLDRAPYVHVRIAPSGASITVNRPEPRASRVVLKPGGEASAPLYYTVVGTGTGPKGGRSGAGCGPDADGTATVALAEGPVSHAAPIGRPGGRGPARLVLCPDQAEVGGFRASAGR